MNGHSLPSAPALRILVVEDDPHVRKFIRLSLQAEKMNVLEADTAEEAITLVHAASPDLMILDLGLPDIDGLQVIRDVRLNSLLPILVLTGRTEDSAKISALEHGADDYIIKPFAIHNLVGRVRSALLQQQLIRDNAEAENIHTGSLSIGLQSRKVSRDSATIDLDEEEYALLRLLAMHGGRVLTAGRIVKALWGDEGDGTHHQRLQKRITALRHKLEHEPCFPRYIVTEPAVGYRLEMIPPAVLQGAE